MTDQNHRTGAKQEKTLSNPFKGTGRRPRFRALWHLKSLGVINNPGDIENRDKKPLSEDWDKVVAHVGNDETKKVKVAIIDTLPAFTHPNLEGAIDLAALRDFSLWPIERNISDLCDEDGDPPNMAFGAHGTAVAGLIAAWPRKDIPLQIPKEYQWDDEVPARNIGVEPEDIDLPYCGVNPFARIIPIIISAAPDPGMLKAAMEYADQRGVDVVLIADSWDRDGTPYPDRDETPSDGPPMSVPYGAKVCANSESPTWEDAEEALLRLSRKAFVFCAAGNEPRNELVYPARLSTASSGPWAVGGCDREGRDLTYTPISKEIRRNTPNSPRLITTLSSEHPRLDEKVQKLDPWEKQDDELSLPDWLFENDFPALDIVTTDVPGPAGYNPSPYDYIPQHNGGKHLEIASLYSRFAGTSASAALAAGLVSLAIAVARADANEDSVEQFQAIGESTTGGPYKGPNKDEEELFNLERAKKLVEDGRPE